MEARSTFFRPNVIIVVMGATEPITTATTSLVLTQAEVLETAALENEWRWAGPQNREVQGSAACDALLHIVLP